MKIIDNNFISLIAIARFCPSASLITYLERGSGKLGLLTKLFLCYLFHCKEYFKLQVLSHGSSRTMQQGLKMYFVRKPRLKAIEAVARQPSPIGLDRAIWARLPTWPFLWPLI